ncbi:copper chaperone PCu(A)C [Streptomyces sp. b94]|uniref:copper chaperone PCu(A)C n=1 Tax=Streptomyces sp. b94 TaxID=1827634 RepID=UPI001B391431|nr:copper chaperone PCu(A)C [Streptomyces sp. b94]MBQ1100047.1 copper chaperone PCu(A)C [Streptomyces sp. b94]
MSSSLRRGALAAAAIAFSIASLAACGAGHNAQSLEIKPDNAATTVGDIQIQNAIVITQPDLESTGPAVVSATLFNNGRSDQKLESITVAGTGKSAELKPAEGEKGGNGGLTVPAGGSLILGGEGNASAVLPSSREAIQDGNAQKITFTFSKTGEVSLRAFVVPAERYFSEWGPSDVPAAPGASAKPSQEASGEPSDGQTSGAPTDGTTDPATGESADADAGDGTDAGTGTGTATDGTSQGTGSDTGH